MTHETDTQDEEGPRTGVFADDQPHAQLWRDARWWIRQMLIAFGPLAELAVQGITRRFGVRISGWLYTIEGAVRRLILVAAQDMKLAPAAAAAKSNAKPKQPSPEPASPIAKDDPADWRVAFRVFSIHAIRRPVKPGIYTLETLHLMPVRRKPPPRGHIRTGPTHAAFALDPLVAIDAEAARASLPPRKAPQRSREPKPRKERLSRWHPDYNPKSDPEHWFIYGSPSLEGSTLDRRDQRAAARARAREQRYSFYGHAPIFAATPPDMTKLPAPGLACASKLSVASFSTR